MILKHIVKIITLIVDCLLKIVNLPTGNILMKVRIINDSKNVVKTEFSKVMSLQMIN